MKQPVVKKKDTNDLNRSPFFKKESDQSFLGNDQPSFFNHTSTNTNHHLSIQRKCAACEGEEERIQRQEIGESGGQSETFSEQAPAESTGGEISEQTPGESPEGGVSEETPGETPATPVDAARFIVGDGMSPDPGQMQKTEFLNRLKEEVCSTVDQALANTPFSSDNCPYIREAFARHYNSSPEQIEALIYRYCPSAAHAQSAEEIIQLMKVKAYAAALKWAQNGSDLSGVSQIVNGIAGSTNSVANSIAGGIGGIVSGIGNLFFKENTGGAAANQSPQSVMQSLGKGSPIESGTKSKMESAFGKSFSDVEIHADSHAAQLSQDMNARAFTVGNHIAFAGGEHEPGTLTGDALMAHELAHVIQQNGATAAPNLKDKDRGNYDSLEQDADQAAMGAVASLWTGAKGRLTDMRRNYKPTLRSKLQLHRCAASGKNIKSPTEQPQGPTPLSERGNEIITKANDEKGQVAARAVEVVLNIINEYYPSEKEKVHSVQFNEELAGTGLHTEKKLSPDHDVAKTKGLISVGHVFLEGVDKKHFSRRVLQVGHELEHINQYRSGLTGDKNKDEREFLAFYHEALATEKPGTGKMQHAGRVPLIDAALGYYNCLVNDKKKQYDAQQKELLARRVIEVKASNKTFEDPPATCVQQ